VLARAVTHALVGLEPRKVEVEAHVQPGVPGFAIVGLVDRACQEAKHRVRALAVDDGLDLAPVARQAASAETVPRAFTRAAVVEGGVKRLRARRRALA